MTARKTQQKVASTMRRWRNNGANKSLNVSSGISCPDLLLRVDLVMFSSPLRFFCRLEFDLEPRRRWVDTRPNVIRHILTELGNKLLRNEDHVPGHHAGILIYVFAMQDVLDIQFLNFSPFIVDAVIEKNLGLCSGRKSAGNTDRFGDGHVVAEVILSGLAHLP